MQDLRNALLIHNPNAGGGGSARRTQIDEARRILGARGIQADLAETTGPGEATEIARSCPNLDLQNGYMEVRVIEVARPDAR